MPAVVGLRRGLVDLWGFFLSRVIPVSESSDAAPGFRQHALWGVDTWRCRAWWRRPTIHASLSRPCLCMLTGCFVCTLRAEFVHCAMQ